jgi:hypothetical protein
MAASSRLLAERSVQGLYVGVRRFARLSLRKFAREHCAFHRISYAITLTAANRTVARISR